MKFELLMSGLVFGIWFVDRLVAQARTDRRIITRELARDARDDARQTSTIDQA